jgi:hypothetical protein
MPSSFPSPENLKNKFIIKCKGARIIPKCMRDKFTEEELKKFDKEPII